MKIVLVTTFEFNVVPAWHTDIVECMGGGVDKLYQYMDDKIIA